jgi:uncharacterized protein YjbI with pentapeptide repeats
MQENSELLKALTEGRRLRDVDAGGASLPGTRLDGLRGDALGFRGADLSGASLRGARLSGCDFGAAALAGADLSESVMRECNFDGTRAPTCFR